MGIDDEGEPTRPGDTFADLAWSPDGRWLVYRVTRGSMAWFEALDTNGSSVPLPITAADPDGSLAWGLADYRGLMSMSPAWSSSNVLYYATFGTGSPTVGIRSLDLSTLIP